MRTRNPNLGRLVVASTLIIASSMPMIDGRFAKPELGRKVESVAVDTFEPEPAIDEVAKSEPSSIVTDPAPGTELPRTNSNPNGWDSFEQCIAVQPTDSGLAECADVFDFPCGDPYVDPHRKEC